MDVIMCYKKTRKFKHRMNIAFTFFFGIFCPSKILKV